MELAGRIAWAAMKLLFAAFVVLALAQLTVFGRGIPDVLIWTPLIAGMLLALVFGLIDLLIGWWWAHRASLMALCLGVSIKPFDWKIGNGSHLRSPGGRLYAFGPLRLAWRIVPAPDELKVVFPAGRHFRAGDQVRIEKVA
jgi:hypothetical protein